MNKLEAIKYLIKNNVYGDEWTGAGMFEAVLKAMETRTKITPKYLDKLLTDAENF